MSKAPIWSRPCDCEANARLSVAEIQRLLFMIVRRWDKRDEDSHLSEGTMPLDPTTPEPPRIVLITDEGMLKPTLFTAWTMLRRFKGNAELHFWGYSLDDWQWESVAHVASCNPEVALRPLRLQAADLAGATPVGDYISEVAMGRLFIPSKLSGRVLYLDGDVRVTADLSPLFSLDMRGHPLAAVRDYVVSSWMEKGVSPNIATQQGSMNCRSRWQALMCRPTSTPACFCSTRTRLFPIPTCARQCRIWIALQNAAGEIRIT